MTSWGKYYQHFSSYLLFNLLHLASNDDNHIIHDLDFEPDRSIHFGVTCRLATDIFSKDL